MHNINENIWVICPLWATCAFAFFWVTLRQNIWHEALYPLIDIKTEKPKCIVGLITALLTISFIFLNPFINQSNIIEIPLLIFTPLISIWWVKKASNLNNAWLRVVIAIVFTIILQTMYLRWLQSDSFPKFLLSQRSLSERQNKTGNYE